MQRWVDARVRGVVRWARRKSLWVLHFNLFDIVNIVV